MVDWVMGQAMRVGLRAVGNGSRWKPGVIKKKQTIALAMPWSPSLGTHMCRLVCKKSRLQFILFKITIVLSPYLTVLI
jgi:hypothetical protein